MNKVLRYILAVLWTAWTGALTLVTGIAVLVGAFKFTDKFLNNNLVSGVLLLILLVISTFHIGNAVKQLCGKGQK